VIFDHLDANTKRWRREIIISKDYLAHEILPNDVVGICIELFNGYDGRTSYGFSLKGFRWYCKNGLIYGKQNLISETFTHMISDIERLRYLFETKIKFFGNIISQWKEWTEISFDFDKFKMFVDSKVKGESNNKGKYLSPKIGELVTSSYPRIMNSQNLNETKWGAFNVLTYISTHETSARKGSNLFSNRFGTLNKLISDFYDV
jgi:hypothetical protein